MPLPNYDNLSIVLRRLVSTRLEGESASEREVLRRRGGNPVAATFFDVV